jgi:hypothetical protein
MHDHSQKIEKAKTVFIPMVEKHNTVNELTK